MLIIIIIIITHYYATNLITISCTYDTPRPTTLHGICTTCYSLTTFKLT